MSEAARLALAEEAMLEGDHASARRIVEVVLAREPANPDALRLRDALRGIEADAAGIPPEALGDLRPDARHLEDPVRIEDALAPPATPIGIVILAGLTVIVGGFTAFLGVVAMLAGVLLAIFVVLLGLAQLGVGVALWRMRPWAWYAAVVVTALGIVLNAVDAASGDIGGLVWGVVQVLVLVYLVRVRGRFLEPPARVAAPT